ncbi:hypothetical protein BGZ57DRAFT_85219 [Hyaloscypha finlandica]|nr:hypothetical protein BGZ57DRAFT_85219 [Hyaloscypha finlandica]
MAGRQRTFELIPTTLAAKSHGNQPTYMTSKQVKKAYQQANRGPRISRAEQRRLDAEELERQNKEYERERAAAKAKAVREKKAAKETADKEARRKMRLPEPSRFVRASQPTISKFVRGGNNGKRSWQEMKMHTLEEDSDGTLPESGFGEKDDAQPPAKRVPAEDDSEDEFGDFPSLSQSDLLEKIDSSMVSLNGGGTGSPAVVAKQPALPPCQEPSQSLPARKYSEGEYPLNGSQLTAEKVNTQLLSEAAEAVQKSDGTELPVPKQTTPKPTLSMKPQQQVQPIPRDILPKPIHAKNQKLSVSTSADSNNARTKPAKPTVVSRPVLQEVSTNMPPPPIPLKEKKAISFAPSPQKDRPLLQITTKTNNKPKYIIPVSGTQVFLENHLDDFFPSPTQEIRELLSDVDDIPSNTQIARELSPDPPKEDLNKEKEFDNLICTQDLILSSQELLEITTPSRPQPKSHVEPEPVKQKPVPRPKPRFFEEKDDDILHAVLHESKTNAARSHGPAPQTRETKRPFFEEKEDDLLAAAIHESKVMAEKRRMVKVPLKETNENERKERTLKRRISSASTDYGEDEFSGEEWDSLGL